MKHTETYLAAALSNETGYFAIPYEEKDVRSRCSLGPYTGCEIRRLSIGMQEVLRTLVCNLSPEFKEKEIRKRIKKS